MNGFTHVLLSENNKDIQTNERQLISLLMISKLLGAIPLSKLEISV